MAVPLEQVRFLQRRYRAALGDALAIATLKAVLVLSFVAVSAYIILDSQSTMKYGGLIGRVFLGPVFVEVLGACRPASLCNSRFPAFPFEEAFWYFAGCIIV
jgi:hypothetical protein